ncbi:unnamed protein product [[Candida] boidinii]|nr:unnamed protein product [[Candida] boidinii]
MSTKNKSTVTVIEEDSSELNQQQQQQKENLPVNDNNLLNKRNPSSQERRINNNLANKIEKGTTSRDHVSLTSKADTPSISAESKNHVPSSPTNTTSRPTSHSSKIILGESTNTACNTASSTDNSQNTTMTSIQTTTTTAHSYMPSHSQKERNVKHSTVNLKSEMISVDSKPQSQINFGNYIENLNVSALNLSNANNLTSNTDCNNANVMGTPSIPVPTPSASVTDLSSSIPKSHHADYQFQNEGSSVYQQSLYSVNINTNNVPQLSSTTNNSNTNNANLNGSNMNLDPSLTISNISPSNQVTTGATHVTTTGLGVTTNNSSTVNTSGVNPFNRVKSKKINRKRDIQENYQ